MKIMTNDNCELKSNMPKGFSKLDILLFIFIIIFCFLAYNKYFKKEVVTENEIVQETPEVLEKTEDKTPEQEVAQEKENDDLALGEYDSILAKNLDGKKVEVVEEKEEEVEEKEISDWNLVGGYYKNQKYQYEISFAKEWPIRITVPEKLEIGTIPPKNGQGYIKVEVSDNKDNEIEQAKAQAKKYAGMVTFTEEDFSLAGVAGKIYILDTVSSPKMIYIMLEKNNLYYLIKYSEESPEFTKQVEEYLKTFKFTS